MKFINLTKGKHYMIRCSDWSVIIEAESEEEACTETLTRMLQENGRDLKLSSVMISHELKPDVMEDEYDDLISYHSVSRMLANAGHHELSSNVKTVFGA